MNNTSKKKIYCINIDGDYGELWLGHDKEPLAHVHSNDANFNEEYQRFIFDYLGVELICEHFILKAKKQWINYMILAAMKKKLLRF